MAQASEPDRQAIERTMRRAEDMGLDPQRVARALDHQPPPPAEHQVTEQVEPGSWVRRLFARTLPNRFAGPS